MVTVRQVECKGFTLAMGALWIAAIFVTQSNDFALGLPIIESVFKSVHPTYVSLLLGSRCFCFMFVQQHRSCHLRSRST